MPETGSWLCLPEPLPEDWTARHEPVDDELFTKVCYRALGAG